MLDRDLAHRINRIYSAIDAVEERNLKNLKGTVINSETVTGVHQDFRGGLSDEQLSNLAQAEIYNIAHLGDHLKKWAKSGAGNPKKVDQTISNSLALQIIIDLSNNDKHGYPRRDGGFSRKSPKLVDLDRVLQLTTSPKAGAGLWMTLAKDGSPVVSGSGSAKAVITGKVVDKDDNRLGDLQDIADEAMKAWEVLLEEFGIKI